MGRQLFTMYEIGVDRLSLIMSDGSERSFPGALENGRVNYGVFEYLVRDLAGLEDTSGPDHQDEFGMIYEQKSYVDPENSTSRSDLFHCSSSSTFPANNYGKTIKKFLDANDYESALELCKEKGYNKSEYYIFTNSGKYRNNVPFRYFIIPTKDLISNLSSEDPRKVSLSRLLGMIQSKVVLV